MLIFLLWIGLLSALSQCSEIERNLDFKGHKSGLYIVDNDEPADKLKNGISYLFQKVNNEVTLHALFHYQENNFAAIITKGMLQNAIQSKLAKNGAKTKIDWKTFLEEELENIEMRLMKPGLSNEQKVSKTSAAIIIVDGNTVTQAQIGHSRILSFANDSKQSETGLRVKESVPVEIKNRLGGRFFKNKDSTIRGEVVVTDLSDVRFIVMGISHFWFVNVDKVAKILSQNVNVLNKAALEITKLIPIPNYEANNGVIVIGLNPSVTILAPERENKGTLAERRRIVPPVPQSHVSRSYRRVNVPTRNSKNSRLLN